MAGRMISELSDATTLQNTDLIPLARGATTLKVSGLTLASSLTSTASGAFASKTDLTSLSSTVDTNFALKSTITSLSSTVNSLSAFDVFDSPTIDLDWNASTRTLSADVKSDSIRYSHLASWQTLSGSPTLSAEAVQQRLVKAWVNFNGTTSPGTIRSSFNVSSVTRNSTGNFTINFTTPMASSNYVIAGSPDQTIDSIGYSHYESIVSATVNGFTILTSGIASGAYVCNPVTIRYCVIGN